MRAALQAETVPVSDAGSWRGFVAVQFGAGAVCAQDDSRPEVHVVACYEGPPAGPGSTVVIRRKMCLLF